MKKLWLGVMLGAAVLAGGCSKKAACTESIVVQAEQETPAADGKKEAAGETGAALEIKETTEAEGASGKAQTEASAAPQEQDLTAAVPESENSGTLEEERSAVRLYRQLVESTDSYKGQTLTFSGKVVRVGAEGSAAQIVVTVEGDRSAMLVCDYPADLIDVELQAGDQVMVTGAFENVYRYRMDNGEARALPNLQVSRFDTVTLAVRPLTGSKTAEKNGSAALEEGTAVSAAGQEADKAEAAGESGQEQQGGARFEAAGQAQTAGADSDPDILEEQGETGSGVIEAGASRRMKLEAEGYPVPKTAGPGMESQPQADDAGPGVESQPQADDAGPGVESQPQPGEIGPGAGAESPLGGPGM